MTGSRPGELRRPVVGRLAEIRVLTDAMAIVEQGGTAAVSLAGEPGIGKTRLLQLICGFARERRFQVLTGRATELEHEIPYSMISDALDDAVRSLSEPELQRLIPTFREDFEPLEDAVNAIAAQGLSYGIHLIIAASRWLEIRAMVKDQIGTRLELRLGDPSDSDMNRRAAAQVPLGRPGRGITTDGLHLLLALPRLDSESDPATVADGVAAAKEKLTELHADSRAPAVRMLPARLDRADVLADAEATESGPSWTRVVIGRGESELQPVTIDFAAQPHLVIFGDVECGKTMVLRNIIAGVVERSTAQQARIILLDYRRTLLGAVEGPHLAGYSTSSQTSVGMLAEVAAYLSERIPPSDITPQELRDRSWWTGPEIYVVVDDYDMVSAHNPLVALLDYLPQARDIGLHVIIARRAGGASRALYDQVLGVLKDMSVDALLMSAPKDEGILLGGFRSTKMPPGRAAFVSRSRDTEMVQISYLPPH